VSIHGFRHRGLSKLWIKNDRSEISAKDEAKIRRILHILNQAKTKVDLNYPGSGFHPLEPKEKNYYALKVDKRFRITFRWDDEKGQALEVNLENYH
jgi:toxin HigB-1